MSYSINDFYKSIVLKLQALYSAEEAHAMADRLFEHYFQLTPTRRVLAADSPVNSAKMLLAEESVIKLLSNIPLQYVLGIAYFMEMEFVVNPSVLIPRPETEELVSLIVKQYSGWKSTHQLSILDIGTGSGCIPVALKRYIPGSIVSAIDISQEALEVATENAALNKVEINFSKTDILNHAQSKLLTEFDLIVSNPPYVTMAEKKYMQPNVFDNEPHTALFVPNDDPLVFYREIFILSKTKLLDGGSLWFEINEMYGIELRDMALHHGFKEANIFFDIRGKSRFLQCFI